MAYGTGGSAGKASKPKSNRGAKHEGTMGTGGGRASSKGTMGTGSGSKTAKGAMGRG